MSASRLRLIVVQALVLSLFGTLFARLWFLQVHDGADYQAQAASQSVREIVVQPTRGLIVDAEGRPLVANRPSWVVSIDRTLLGRMDAAQRRTLLRRVGAAVDLRPRAIRRQLLDCGDPGSERGSCWNGSPYQPVPIAADVGQGLALRFLEQAEDFPAVLVERQTVRDYPQPFGVNAAHLLGYLSPITEEELEAAERRDDPSVNGASTVGRAGVEKRYDAWLRGMPGYRNVTVDSMGRVLGPDSAVRGRPGSTLVTSLDARVQAVVERTLARSIAQARRTFDDETGRYFEADSGAAVVMEADTGRIVAMASQPTYDPGVWVGGISARQFRRLYAERAGTPLLSRATQGQFAPASTWKPLMSVGALENGYSQSTRLNCTSFLQVGNRAWKNYASASYGYIDFAQAMQLSCDTFYYRIGLAYWQRYGSDPQDVTARDPLVETAQDFGFGRETGVDLPGEAAGRIADRRWKRAYYRAMKDYYCEHDAEPGDDFLHRFAREFCLEGDHYRAGDAVNFSIGQGDTVATPLQLARAYGALANGGRLMQPLVAKAVVSPAGEVLRRFDPVVQKRVDARRGTLEYVDRALLGTATAGTTAGVFGGFPLGRVRIRSKTGTAEVYGRQTTSWVATYDDTYVVVMMVEQAGTGSAVSGVGSRAIWEALYGVRGDRVVPERAAIEGTVPPAGLPTFTADGAILPPAREEAIR